jgi:formylmethanofuran dehydrogenase subunit E
MRIIKEQHLDEKKVICSCCGSELAYTRKDITTNGSIICPVCNAFLSTARENTFKKLIDTLK